MWRSALVIQYTTWCLDGCAHNAMPICKGIVSVSTMLFPVPFYFPWFPPVDSWLVHPSQYVKRLRVPCISSSSVYSSLLVLLSNPSVVPCHIWIDLKFLLSCNGVSRLAIFDPTFHHVDARSLASLTNREMPNSSPLLFNNVVVPEMPYGVDVWGEKMACSRTRGKRRQERPKPPHRKSPSKNVRPRLVRSYYEHYCLGRCCRTRQSHPHPPPPLQILPVRAPTHDHFTPRQSYPQRNSSGSPPTQET